MRVGDRGPEVWRLQQALLREGGKLPRYGADGDFGSETARALQTYAGARAVTWRTSDDVPPELLAMLGLAEAAPARRTDADPLVLDVEFYDLRGEQTDPHPRAKLSRGKTLVRDPAAIDAIVLHQTDVEFGGGSGAKLARRSLGVACHAMAFRDGFLAWPTPLLWHVYHADRLNSRSLGLEVDGQYPGLRGGKISKGRKPTELTEATVAAARAGVKLLVVEGRRIGCPIKYIYAHRQSDSWRRADPGQELWERVVLEYAVPELGLETRPHETFGHPKGKARNGKPIPATWDAAGVGRY